MKTRTALVLTFIAGACVGTVASNLDTEPTASASTPVEAVPVAGTPQGSVLHAADQVVLHASHGKARIVEYARGKNAFVGRLELDPGVAVKEHQDETEEFIHVLSGSGSMTIDGKSYEVGTGATVYMPANARVTYTNGPEPLVALQVFAGPAPADKYAEWSPK